MTAGLGRREHRNTRHLRLGQWHHHEIEAEHRGQQLVAAGPLPDRSPQLLEEEAAGIDQVDRIVHDVAVAVQRLRITRRRDERIGSPGQHQHARFDGPRVDAPGRQRAMEAHDGIEVGTGLRHAQHDHPSEAIPDCGDVSGVHVGIAFQNVECGVEPRGALDHRHMAGVVEHIDARALDQPVVLLG